MSNPWPRSKFTGWMGQEKLGQGELAQINAQGYTNLDLANSTLKTHPVAVDRAEYLRKLKVLYESELAGLDIEWKCGTICAPDMSICLERVLESRVDVTPPYASTLIGLPSELCILLWPKPGTDNVSESVRRYS